jgi:hypothetical protein
MRLSRLGSASPPTEGRLLDAKFSHDRIRGQASQGVSSGRASRLVYSALTYVFSESTLVFDINPRVLLREAETPPAAVSVVLARSQSEA